MQSICYYPRSITAAESTKRNQDHRERMDWIQYLAGRKCLSPPLLTQPLDELRQQQVQGGQDRREAALRKTDQETRFGSQLFLFVEKT
jgi:hypothetical protein